MAAHHADIVVIGAGMAGAAAAAHLAAGAKVILIERESQPGYHSTGRSAALFTATYGNLTIRTLTHASRDFYLAWADGFTEHPILTPRGAMLYAPPEQMGTLNTMWGEMAPLDRTLRLLDGKEAREIVPALRPDRVEAAIFEPEAMDIDVHNLHQGYLRLFRRRGGEIRTDAEVTTLSRAGGVWTVATRAGEFAAPLVVNAAGAWADVVAGMAGLPPVGLQPKRRTAMIVPAPAGFDTNHWPMVIDADETGYFKPDAGKLLVSPADETPVGPQDIQPEELDVAIAIDRLERATTLKIGRVERRWAGLRSFVPDHTPVNGFDPLADGFFWLAGQGGYGIMTAEGMAKTAASLIATGALPPDIAALGITAESLGPGRLR
ncbi:MAG TPA: FAD-binding oxidoreductase [Stellaceae bacterium]|jgi:D-arginine dehydrogenase